MNRALIASFFGLAAMLALVGCSTPPTSVTMQQMYQRDTIGEAESTVRDGDRLALYFEPSKSVTLTSPAVWKNVFNGSDATGAKIVPVEEELKMTMENLGLTARLRYSVSAAFTVNGQVRVLTAQADSFALMGNSKLTREVMEKALVSIAKQARAYLNPPM